MKNNARNLLIGVLLLTLTYSFGQTDEGWKKEIDKNDILIFTRKVKDSKLKEFKAITTLNVKPVDVMNVLKDFDSYTQWFYNYENVKLLESINENEYRYYVEISAPWPVQNRDMVVYFKAVEDMEANGYLIELKGIPEYIPTNKNLVRIPAFTGTWKITSLEEGRTNIISRVHADPGGAIPDWFANLMMTKGPYTTFTNLKGRVEGEKE